ncbi:glucose PTS transporter subunit IIA [Nocardioides lijunqiniae]|uniref:glucose PTS transporter subunit IIA n=1 Tax=Nocardioides lijunqiniae TaxID=2760832 RepID=UPI0018779C07
MTEVRAPLPGRVVAMGDVPDPVFSSEMVGPGIAIEPDPGEVTVVSPVAGTVVKVHPHAFIVLASDGVGVLVHLGIDTVKLDGRGFEVLVTQGSTVEAGTPMVRWDPATLEDGMSPLVPVVAMDRPKGSVPAPSDGTRAAAGDLLFTVAP